MAEIGDRIGPFEIIELLERGAVSNLYRGLRADGSSRPPREVVLRVAAGGAAGPDPEAFGAVRAEYETLRVLEDERIPTVVALYGGHGASAKAWVTGGTLRDTLTLVEAGRIDLDAATSMDILVELAYALRHAHAIVREEGRIVHGALAPEVVLLTAEGKVMLLGMGDPEPSHPRPLAPEQQQGTQDPRTDQWLLGALGIELLRHAPEVLQEARGAPIEVAYGLLQARWPAATRVLARMLAEAPANRYDAEERLIKDLLALSRHLGGVSRRAEVGARTIQLASSIGGADAPPMPMATLVRRREETAARPPPRPLAAPVVTTARAPHPSTAPVVEVESAPEVLHFFEPPGMEEVVAYTEETPLPFKPRRSNDRSPPAVDPPAAALQVRPATPVSSGPTLRLGPAVRVGPSVAAVSGTAASARAERGGAASVAAVSAPTIQLGPSVAAASVAAVSAPTIQLGPSVAAVSPPAVSVAAVSAPTSSGPALRTLGEALLLPPLFDEDPDATTVEDRPFSNTDDGPSHRQALAAAADAQPTEMYRPGLSGNPFVMPAEAAVGAEAWPDEGLSSASDVAGAPSIDPGADGRLPFRPATPPVEDPVPDQWVIGAIGMFVLVTAIVLVWRFSGG